MYVSRATATGGTLSLVFGIWPDHPRWPPFFSRGESRMPAAWPQMIGARQEKSTPLADLGVFKPLWVVRNIDEPRILIAELLILILYKMGKMLRIILSNTSCMESCMRIFYLKKNVDSILSQLLAIETNTYFSSIFLKFPRMAYNRLPGAIFDHKFYKRFD